MNGTFLLNVIGWERKGYKEKHINSFKISWNTLCDGSISVGNILFSVSCMKEET